MSTLQRQASGVRALIVSDGESRSSEAPAITWKHFFELEKKKPYFKKLSGFVAMERKQHTIYPPDGKVFTAFKATPFQTIRAVIMGQDPYHTQGAAHGLAFSVEPGQPIPPSLKNIFRELKDDLGYPIPDHGCLQHWADQGVFLLNRVLTVRESEANSHANQGWEQFTDSAIRFIADNKEDVVFLLWGKKTQTIKHNIKLKGNYSLSAGHPSPFSVKSFFGCRHFSRTNRLLKQAQLFPIFWGIPS